MREAITLIIPGPPVPKGRPRVYGGHGVTPQRTRDAERTVRDLFMRENPDFVPFTCRLMVSCHFWLMKTGRPDIDNLMKLPIDALNNLAYVDDEQIDVLWGRRYMPDRRVPGQNGRMRWRHSGDPYTWMGEEYEPHTCIRIEPLPDLADLEKITNHRKENHNDHHN